MPGAQWVPKTRHLLLREGGLWHLLWKGHGACITEGWAACVRKEGLHVCREDKVLVCKREQGACVQGGWAACAEGQVRT